MKKFRFRLEALLSLRQSELEVQQKSVAEALQALEIIRRQLKEKEGELTLLKQSLQGQLSGAVAVDDVLSHGRYEVMLVHDRNELAGQVRQIEDELEKRRGLLQEADSELKRIEKMKDLKQTQHAEESLLQMQQEIDESASNLWQMANRRRAGQ